MSDSHETKSLAIIPKSLGELTQLAELLSKSELLPKALRGKVPDVAMTIMAGQEMGFTPMASLRNFHVIEGKPVLSADGMVALAMGSGKAVYFRRTEESDDRVTYETLRVGDTAPRRCTWTGEMAKNAAIDKKDNWRLFKRAMLAARAKSELARDVYPDVLAGCAAAEEVEHWRPVHTDAIDVEYTDIPSEPEPSELQAIDTAESEESLKAMAPSLKTNIPAKWKDEANKRYAARLKTLREVQA